MFAHMTAEIPMPNDGFTLDDLKAGLRKVRAPNDCRIKPAIVRTADDHGSTVDVEPEVRFVVEWVVD